MAYSTELHVISSPSIEEMVENRGEGGWCGSRSRCGSEQRRIYSGRRWREGEERGGGNG
jgi:hypothetical protein